MKGDEIDRPLTHSKVLCSFVQFCGLKLWTYFYVARHVPTLLKKLLIKMLK